MLYNLGINVLRYKGYKYFTDIDEVINWLYLNGVLHEDISSRAILALLNVNCEVWNENIQNLNNNIEEILLSANQLAEVDDPRGVFKEMLNQNTLQFYGKSGVPRHNCYLCIYIYIYI